MVYKSLNDYYNKYNNIKNKLVDSCKQYINDKDKKSLSGKDMMNTLTISITTYIQINIQYIIFNIQYNK